MLGKMTTTPEGHPRVRVLCGLGDLWGALPGLLATNPRDPRPQRTRSGMTLHERENAVEDDPSVRMVPICQSESAAAVEESAVGRWHDGSTRVSRTADSSLRPE